MASKYNNFIQYYAQYVLLYFGYYAEIKSKLLTITCSVVILVYKEITRRVMMKVVKLMKKYNLSNSEEILMNMLWKENAPLTVSQLSEKITEADWKPNYVDKLVKQLVKKGMVKADGIQQDRFYRSQQFVPCLTKDEFLANMLEEQGVNNALFARIAVALFKKDRKQRTPEQDEKLIAELEKMVDEYEAQIEEKSKEK